MKTEERNRLIYEAWKNGKSAKEIAEEFHCTPSTVNYIRESYKALLAMRKTLVYRYILEETDGGNDHRTAKRIWIALNRKCNIDQLFNRTANYPPGALRLTTIRGKGIRILFFIRNATPSEIKAIKNIGPKAWGILERVKHRINKEFGIAGLGDADLIKNKEQEQDQRDEWDKIIEKEYGGHNG